MPPIVAGKCPKEPQLHIETKIRVIDSFIRPCIYAMEVWAPSGRNEAIEQTGMLESH
jgi:hypothetical protein